MILTDTQIVTDAKFTGMASIMWRMCGKYGTTWWIWMWAGDEQEQRNDAPFAGSIYSTAEAAIEYSEWNLKVTCVSRTEEWQCDVFVGERSGSCPRRQ